MKATFFQNNETNSSYSFEFENGLTEKQINKIVGTACQRFYRFSLVAKKCNVKGFKYSEPIHVKIETENKVFNTKLAEEFQAGLKLQRNPAGVHRFASRVLEIVSFANEEIKTTGLADLKKKATEYKQSKK